MNRETLEMIGIQDRTGNEIRNGDVFQYENMYIVTKDSETGSFFIREYENQVEYGVDEEAYYILVGTFDISDVELENDQVVDNIFCNPELTKYLHDDEEE